ncbi:hypothetical protein PR202_ga16017 [Eleusine coracana subsp. coracana]|uniref:FLZ-type domain-containing protein n=1 Tax=Eleusine coracana subsp. coracana TaxID=191504 RepID=A0AAV5CKF8_ELECO|nr:hypothetical protein PR202_ga16017 [Eleusine coracana subsp. coracana]
MEGTRQEMASRNPVRRTTSLTDFAPPEVLSSVFEDEEEVVVAHQPQPNIGGGQDWLAAFGGAGGAAKQEEWLAAYRARAAPARAGLRRNSADCSATEAAAFLRACGLCRRRLGPGRDTFMYKGETAFCSLECRQQHMTQEEWKDKCTVTSRKDASGVPAPGRRRGSSGKPGTGGNTVAAA